MRADRWEDDAERVPAVPGTSSVTGTALFILPAFVGSTGGDTLMWARLVPCSALRVISTHHGRNFSKLWNH